jgi:hypothetical protein
MKLIDIGAFGPVAADQVEGNSKGSRSRSCTWDTSPRSADQAFAADAETYEFARPVLSSVGDLKSAIMHDGGPWAIFSVAF